MLTTAERREVRTSGLEIVHHPMLPRRHEMQQLAVLEVGGGGCG